MKHPIKYIILSLVLLNTLTGCVFFELASKIDDSIARHKEKKSGVKRFECICQYVDGPVKGQEESKVIRALTKEEAEKECQYMQPFFPFHFNRRLRPSYN